MSDFAIYGTPFEVLEDEEKDAITRKPKGIQDEIVTDEKGRRRFHGAFTGGFSAGYFNSVGSKHGWVPQTFKSSRESRAEKIQISAEDLMDDEDMGEFGIASRKIRPKRDFMDAFALPGEKQLLAWERSVLPSSSSISDEGLSAKLAEIIRPVNDSIGIRLLKKMGWREGRGIGPKMNRKSLERQKLNELRAQGKTAVFDKEAVESAQEFVPNFEFSPEDISRVYFTSKEDKHGLGYVGILETSVLKQSYGEMAATLKVKQKSKGIKGQAFGVGAFEDDDEDIYTSFDLSQYDFELDSSSTSVPEVARYDSTFVQSTKKSALRKNFPLPKLPHDFKHTHKPIPVDIKKMPEEIRKLGHKMTALQRAQFLGERDVSVMEMLSSKDRERLKRGGSRWDKKPETVNTSAAASTSGVQGDPFEEEPMKSHRFKQYVQYLRRGLTYPQPIDMTQLEWEHEVEEFQNHLSPELRSLLPEVRARQQPLAKVAYADSIMEQLKGRFQKETKPTSDELHHEKMKVPKDHDRLSAVKMKMFGEKTRTRYDWHPAKDLCKRFNIPDPYPGSMLVGVLQLQKKPIIGKNEDTMELAGLGLPNTALELTRKREKDEFEKETQRIVNENVHPHQIKQEEPTEDTELDRPMFELLKAIFDESEEENEPEEENETKIEEPIKPQLVKETTNGEDLLKRFEPKPLPPLTEKVLTVMELVESDEEEEFGPKPPPNLPSDTNEQRMSSPEIKFIPRAATQQKPILEEEKLAKKSKHKKKHKSKEKKKKHKSKHHSKKKKRRNDSSSESVTDNSSIISSG